MPMDTLSRDLIGDLKNQFSKWLPQYDSSQEVERGPTGLFRWRPQTDIYEEAGETIIEVEVPGLHRDDLDVHVENGRLSITGERRDEREIDEGERDYYRTERVYGRFQRTFQLPDQVNPDEITARYDDGVLKVTLPEHQPGRHQVDVA